jgi:hypothetical protein
MLTDLYHRISSSVCVINVFLDGEKISEGSGFCFSHQGEVLTSAHVVTGRFPIRQEDYSNPNQKVFCKFPGLPAHEYKVFMCAIPIEVPEAFTQPIQLDLAILLPAVAWPSAPTPLPTSVHPPQLGERVFMAGYSEELELPFKLERVLSRSFKGAQEFLKAMDEGYMADMTGPLIKQGFVGNTRRIGASGKHAHLECEVLYIDNAMHSGASGGPVVNAQGHAVGIITQRAVTSASQSEYPNLKVPSGCTVALALQPMAHVERVTNGKSAA